VRVGLRWVRECEGVVGVRGRRVAVRRGAYVRENAREMVRQAGDIKLVDSDDV